MLGAFPCGAEVEVAEGHGLALVYGVEGNPPEILHGPGSCLHSKVAPFRRPEQGKVPGALHLRCPHARCFLHASGFVAACCLRPDNECSGQNLASLRFRSFPAICSLTVWLSEGAFPPPLSRRRTWKAEGCRWSQDGHCHT